MSQSDSANASNTVFDKVAGKAKEMLGHVTGNDDLVVEGELQQTKAEVSKRAVELTAEAEHAEREAAVKAEQAENAVAQDRIASQIAERTREQELERSKAAAEVAVEHEASQREVAAERQLTLEQEAIERSEVDATADLIDGASEAAEIELDAKRAENAAETLNRAQHQLGQN